MATTMEEYVNAYYGGELGISKRYGIIKTDDLIETADPSAAFNTVYGAKVYNQLNTKSEVFKLLKKEPWTQSGWRVLTGRHDGTGGVAENDGSNGGGALPDTAQPDIVNVKANLKQIATTWEISTKAAMLSESDDGMGNLAAFMRKENSEAHLFAMDQMLLADSETAAGNNLESLDRVTISHACNGAMNNAATDADLWDITDGGIDRSGSAWSDPQVVHNSDTPRALKLEYLDTIIQGALENGVNYSSLILLTGYDTYQDLKQLMASGNTGSAAQATFRYDLKQAGAGSLNGVQGEAGLAFDSRVGSYDGIPIFLSQHCVGDSASRIYLLDMDNLAFRVAAPTTYLENSNVAVTQKASHEHLLMTAGNLIAYKFKTMGSVRDNL